MGECKGGNLCRAGRGAAPRCDYLLGRHDRQVLVCTDRRKATRLRRCRQRWTRVPCRPSHSRCGQLDAVPTRPVSAASTPRPAQALGSLRVGPSNPAQRRAAFQRDTCSIRHEHRHVRIRAECRRHPKVCHSRCTCTLLTHRRDRARPSQRVPRAHFHPRSSIPTFLS